MVETLFWQKKLSCTFKQTLNHCFPLKNESFTKFQSVLTNWGTRNFRKNPHKVILNFPGQRIISLTSQSLLLNLRDAHFGFQDVQLDFENAKVAYYRKVPKQVWEVSSPTWKSHTSKDVWKVGTERYYPRWALKYFTILMAYKLRKYTK